jgi:hypothetical protein
MGNESGYYYYDEDFGSPPESDMDWYYNLEEQTGNPHFRDYLYDTCDLLQSSNPIIIQPNETTYDPIMMEDVNIVDYLQPLTVLEKINELQEKRDVLVICLNDKFLLHDNLLLWKEVLFFH